jgi:hypothetical protein
MKASRYNSEAAFNPHYNIGMDKSHILMADGYPLYQIHSDGGANDAPFAEPFIDRLPGAHLAPGRMGFHANCGYILSVRVPIVSGHRCDDAMQPRHK